MIPWQVSVVVLVPGMQTNEAASALVVLPAGPEHLGGAEVKAGGACWGGAD